jgi:hypothetical protein
MDFSLTKPDEAFAVQHRLVVAVRRLVIAINGASLHFEYVTQLQFDPPHALTQPFEHGLPLVLKDAVMGERVREALSVRAVRDIDFAAKTTMRCG